MSMPGILIVADDLTGAVDTCAIFANRGIHTVVALEPEALPGLDAPVRAVNMGTREGTLEDARRQHVLLGRRIRAAAPEILVKKTDMGFRGNHGGEIEGLLEGLGARVCYLVNAIPGGYASVEDACQYVKGKPLVESMYAQDPSRKPTTSRIPELLRKQTALAIGTVPLAQVRGDGIGERVRTLVEAGCRLLVFDAVTEEDCLRIVRETARLPYTAFYAGTLGILNALAEWGFPQCRPQPVRPASPPPRCLGFTTSHYDTVERQLAYAQARGLAQVALDMDACLAGAARREEALAHVLEACERHLPSRNVIVTQQLRHPPADPALSGRILEAMAACAELLCARCRFDRLFIIGGETSRSILEALKVRYLTVTAMPEQGIALGRLDTGVLCGRSFAAKGGSVGTDQAVWRMLSAAADAEESPA